MCTFASLRTSSSHLERAWGDSQHSNSDDGRAAVKSQRRRETERRAEGDGGVAGGEMDGVEGENVKDEEKVKEERQREMKGVGAKDERVTRRVESEQDGAVRGGMMKDEDGVWARKNWRGEVGRWMDRTLLAHSPCQPLTSRQAPWQPRLLRHNEPFFFSKGPRI